MSQYPDQTKNLAKHILCYASDGMPKEPSKDIIFELVQWIDSKKNTLFYGNDIFRGEMRNIAIALVTIPIVVGLIVYEYGVNLAFQGAYDLKAMVTVIPALFSSLAVEVALLAFFKPDFEKNALKIRYKRALDLHKKEVKSDLKLKDFTDDEKIALWALIEIGSNNEVFSLEQLYSFDKSKIVFTREKLLEKLCKQS